MATTEVDRHRRWRQANPDYRARNLDRIRDNEYRRVYGITLADYERMLALQGGVCAICEAPPTPKRRLAVDHDHACCPGSKGACGLCVRGLLCHRCNGWLAAIEDRSWLRRATDYLIRDMTRRAA